MSDSDTGGSGSHLVLLLELLLFTIGLTGVLIMQVDRAQPQPYMDEVFHVPMAQRWCQGHYWHWDPKVTTPPGLYAYSAGLMTALAWLFGYAQPVTGKPLCDTFRLRLTNLPAVAACLLAAYGIVSSFASPQSLRPRVQVLKAFSLSLLPVSFFFSSLFYTDQLSLACVLVMYFLHLNEHRVASAAAGALSLTCRQTNAAWICLCVGQRVEQHWLAQVASWAKKTDRKSEEAISASVIDSLLFILQHPVMFAQSIAAGCYRCWPHLAVLLGFAGFVVANGGVALGDKGAHAAQLHAAHPLYFVAFVATMQPHAFLHPSSLRASISSLLSKRGVLVTVAMGAACCLAVAMGTVEHPYLLADNRHFTFYIWRRVMKRHWIIPYALIPAYLHCICTICQLAKHRTALFPPLLLACTAAVLIPAGLIEPRYYIAPFLLWRLHTSRFDSRRWLALEIAYYAILNAIVYRLFLFKAFSWPDGSQQRFMW